MTELSNSNLVHLVNGMRMLLMHLALQDKVVENNTDVLDALWISTEILEKEYCSNSINVMSFEQILEKIQIDMLEDMFNKEEGA